MDLNRLDEEVPIFFGDKEYHSTTRQSKSFFSDAGIVTQKAGMLRGHSIPGCASKVLAQFPAVGCQVHCGDRTFDHGLRFVARFGSAEGTHFKGCRFFSEKNDFRLHQAANMFCIYVCVCVVMFLP